MPKSGETTPQIPPKPHRWNRQVSDVQTQTTPQDSSSDFELDSEGDQSFQAPSDQSGFYVSHEETSLAVPPDSRDLSYERRKKRLRRSLKKCCCCVDLRVGCCFMGFFELCSSAICLVFGESNWMLYIGRLGYMAYLIGSAMLMVGTFLEWQCLVRIYLFTNVVHLLLCPLLILQHGLKSCVYCYYEIVVLSFLLLLGLYFGLVAYSYLLQIQWQHSRFYMPYGRIARNGIRRSRREDIEEVQPAVESQEQEQEQARELSLQHSQSDMDPSNEKQSVL
ncbi:uncharacterized protein LOC108151811 [Drosophila miranda]|uniref:uncharacterized protein LOC108151811 n=1 Tax=Drosophila miranda TaxID=7229 RepID=UPI0007E5C319|nr:uncharacterized protein LOC108151811 [Drosophila miranda]